MRMPISRVRCATAKDRQSVEADGGDHQGKRGEGLEEVSNEFLASEGVFDGLMDGLDTGGCCVGRDFVKSFVELRAQGIRWNSGANGHLDESRCDTVHRRSWFSLRKTEVDLRLG